MWCVVGRTFSSYLNYNTFLSSAYSSAMVAVLSNWSIVMDAGVRCAKVTGSRAGSVYLFFFALRITLVWIVIPTLMVSAALSVYVSVYVTAPDHLPELCLCVSVRDRAS
jgi:hypothetical protein